MRKNKTQLERTDDAVNKLRAIILNAQAEADKIKPDLPNYMQTTADFGRHAMVDWDNYMQMWIRESCPHDDAEEISEESYSDIEYARYRCNLCGHTWREEVPQ